jgi:hypothetical protein
MLVKLSNTKFHEDVFAVHEFLCGQEDGWAEWILVVASQNY